MNLEDQLRDALRRQDPPEGFAERVLQRQSSPPRQSHFRPRFRPSFRVAWPAAIAAMAVLGLSVSIEYRNIQAARAGRQAIQALQMASEELNLARNKVLNKESE